MAGKVSKIDELRHSCAHLLAAAVMKLYPKAKRTIGPAIENGFYYDFDFQDQKVSENDFEKIEKAMKDISKSWKKFEKIEVTKNEALEIFKDNQYKIELIEEFSKQGKKLTLFKSGDFVDLCRGGHADLAKNPLVHFKLLSIAGAYWRGDEKNKMLTRIYGTIYKTQDELINHLESLEEAKKRDHRKLGKEMDLFAFSDHVGSGMPLYTPRGALVRKLLNNLIEEEQLKLGYQQVWTPQIAKGSLFKISGHYDKYKDDMFEVKSHYSDEEFFLKPMNCPQHTQIYASRPRTYKDLPIRYSDFAMLYRDERPGELNGLARVRAFSTDDCHIFCRPDQVDEEIDKALEMTKKVMKIFGLKYRYRLSTRDPKTPEKYFGDPKTWDMVEKWAVKIMKRNKIDYFEAPGEAAFYAPKMDLMATDSLNREWQLSTVQIDYVQPSRFDLEYTDSENQKQTPVMIHRAVLGSSERAMMILIEHFAGNFPLWLNPEQIRILNVGQQQREYVQNLNQFFTQNGIRSAVDARDEKLGSKIRDAKQSKVNYIIVIGEKEVKNDTLSVNKRGQDASKIYATKAFLEKIKKEIEEKSIN